MTSWLDEIVCGENSKLRDVRRFTSLPRMDPKRVRANFYAGGLRRPFLFGVEYYDEDNGEMLREELTQLFT